MTQTSKPQPDLSTTAMTVPVPCEGGFWMAKGDERNFNNGPWQAVCTVCRKPAADHPHRHPA